MAIKMNKIRLLILANFLDNVPLNKFNLESWRDGWSKGWYKGYTGVTDQDLTDVSCGTTGCAIGHACAIPEFIQEGLVWKGCPVYGHYEAWEAVHNFFEISPSMARTLFSDALYSQGGQGPKDVAKRIRALCRKESNEQ
jgi:hypothetical protein